MQRSTIHNYLIYIFIFSISFILPFVYSTRTIDINIAPQFLVISICLALTFVLMVYNPSGYYFGIFKSKFLFFLVGYLSFSGISIFNAVNPGEGVFDFMKLFLFGSVILAGTVILGSYSNSYKKLSFYLTLSAFFLSLSGIAQHLDIGLDFIPGNLVPSSTQANKNLFSSALLGLMPFVVCSVIYYSGAFKHFSVFVLFLAIFNIIIIKSRASWLSLGLVVPLTYIIYILMERKFHLMRKWAGINKILIVSILTLFIFFFGYVFYASDVDLTKYSIFNLISGKERILLWEKSVSMFLDHPISGIGLGQWKIAIPFYGLGDLTREAKIGELYYQSPENDFLWILSETGIGGFGFFILMIFMVYFMGTKIILNSKETENKRVILILLSGFTLYLAGSFFSFPKERIYHIVLLALMVSFIGAKYFSEFSLPDVKNRKIINYILPFILLGTVISCYIGLIRLKSEIYAKEAILARETDNNNFIVERVDRALSPFTMLDPMATPLYFYRGTALFGMNKPQEALIDFLKAEKIYPYHLHVLNNIATCYSLSGNYEKAVEYYEKTTNISPAFQDALMNLAALHYNKKEYRKAHETLLRCKPETKDLSRFLEIKSAIESSLPKEN